MKRSATPAAEQPSDHEIRAWLSAIVESSSDAIIGSRLDGTVFSWNAGAEALYGYTPAEAIGQPVSIVVPPDRRGELQTIIDTLRGGAKIPAYETIRVTKDGRRIDVSITASPIVSDGEVVGYSAIARSIAERKRVEEALRDSEERLTSALFASETGTFRWHIDDDVLEWDESLRRLFGVPPHRDISRAADFLALVHDDDRDRVLREIQRCVEERAVFASEFRVQRPDGVVRWVAQKARIFSDPTGRPKYLTGACRDVTKRKGAEERLRTALAEKDGLLQQKDLLLKEVNHRVKNGLQMVAGLLSLQSRYANDPEVTGQLEGAHGRVMTVARVHERLYQSDEIGIVELGQYLRGMCDDLVHSMAPETGLFNIAVEVPEIGLPADKIVLIGLIVNELVTNAMRHAYTDGRGLVQVGAEIENGTLSIAVRDSGPGLPEGFEPGRSRGFGMKLVRGLAQQHEGRVDFERRSPGTMVRLIVPLGTATHPDGSPGGASAGTSGRSRGMAILA
jgi:PAS domain S-box-containing protein